MRGLEHRVGGLKDGVEGLQHGVGDLEHGVEELEHGVEGLEHMEYVQHRVNERNLGALHSLFNINIVSYFGNEFLTIFFKLFLQKYSSQQIFLPYI